MGKPLLGEVAPSEVRAEVEVSLRQCRPDVAAEWSALRKHDVVFLLGIDPPNPGEAEGGTFAQQVIIFSSPLSLSHSVSLTLSLYI